MLETTTAPSVQANSPTIASRWSGLYALAFGTIIDGQEGLSLTHSSQPIRDALGLNYTALGTFTAINELAKIVMQPV